MDDGTRGPSGEGATDAPLLTMEKRSIMWMDLLYVAGFILYMTTMGLMTCALILQGSLGFVVGVIPMVLIAYFLRDIFVDGIRKQHAATFTLYPDRAVMTYRRRPRVSVDLDPGVEADVRYDFPERGFSVERVSTYILSKNGVRLLEIDLDWGWRHRDVMRMWNPFLEVIRRNGLRLGRELSLLRETGDLEPVGIDLSRWGGMIWDG